jgi:general secretion pathway protein L
MTKTFLAVLNQPVSHWIDTVAAAVAALIKNFTSSRVIRFAEDENGDLVRQIDGQDGENSQPERIQFAERTLSHPQDLAATLQGSRVELTLQPHRFLFRTIDLPSRASEFLSGIVQSQIDRLTPWSAADAAFGWSDPVQDTSDRLFVTVAATGRSFIEPYVRAVAEMGAKSIAVLTAQTETGATPIKIWEQKAEGILDTDRIRHVLVGILAAAVITAGVAIGASGLVVASLDDQRQDLERQITSARKMQTSQNTSAPETIDRQNLIRRKNETPSSVMVLEFVSKVLPDHTYVTEFRVEGNKVRLVGITQDAPSLIAILEQSHFFSQASFFAPTTRSPSYSGERFHIEAIVQGFAMLRS